MKILCIHQGYELYGSDRSFLQSLSAMRRQWPHAHITAFIPKDGPISSPLRAIADEVLVEDLWVPRKNALAKLFTIDAMRFPFSVMRARNHMRQYDLAYINTMTILNYNVAARFAKVPAIIHVREIVGDKASAVFSAILRFSGADVIFNSNATAQAFRLNDNQSSHIIHNGIAAREEVSPPQPGEKLKLLMLGRFNSWKGQDLLVDAISQLPQQEQRQMQVRIVGGVFEDQHHFVENIKRKIAENGLGEAVEILPFTTDPTRHYAWADVVAVPSRNPEPFGRVAVEAMASARPVLAAGHGGLAEIIEHDRSGWLFEPNNARDCANILSSLIADKEQVTLAGERALSRFKDHFSEARYQKALITVCQNKEKTHEGKNSKNTWNSWRPGQPRRV